MTPRVVIGLLVAAAAVALSAATIAFLPALLYFPSVDFFAPDEIRIAFIQRGERTREACLGKAADVENALRTSCPACKVETRCERGQTPEQKAALSREPLSVPSAWRADGALVVTIHARDAAAAETVCEASARASEALPAPQRLTCFPAGAAR